MNTQTLERTTITVQHVQPAPAAGKSARLKDVDGMLFGIWPDKLAGIMVGGTYDIEFTAKTVNGVVWRDIKQVRASDRPGPAPKQFTGGSYDRQPDRAPQPATPEPGRQPPLNNGNGGGQYYRPTSPRDSERMFVCSTLNAFIQTGRIDCHRDHLASAINEMRAAYAATFGADD